MNFNKKKAKLTKYQQLTPKIIRIYYLLSTINFTNPKKGLSFR